MEATTVASRFNRTYISFLFAFRILLKYMSYISQPIFTGNGDLSTQERKRGNSQEGGCEFNQGVICSSKVVVRRILKSKIIDIH